MRDQKRMGGFVIKRKEGWLFCVFTAVRCIRGEMLLFWMRVPEDIRKCIGIKEVRIPLRINHPREADRKAQHLAWVASKLFNDIREGKLGPMAELDKKQIRQRVVSWLKEALKDDERSRVTRARMRSRESIDMEEETLSMLQSNLMKGLSVGNHKWAKPFVRGLLKEHRIDLPENSNSFRTLCRELLKAQIQFLEVIRKRTVGDCSSIKGKTLFFPGVQDAPEVPLIMKVSRSRRDVDRGPLLSKLMEKYLEEKVCLKEWKQKAGPNNIAMIRDFIEMTEDKPVGLLTARDVRKARAMTLRFPSNRTKKKQYRDKTISQLMEMDIPEKDCLSLTTVKKRGSKVRSFLLWIHRQGYPIAQGLEEIYTFKALGQKAE